MRRASLIVILLILLVSLSLLSVLSNILTGYPQRLPEDGEKQEERRTGRHIEKEQSFLLFKVSPARPQLFWRISTADYYTGLNWFKTTNEEVLKEFPQTQSANATKVFTVEVSTTHREILLPLASPNSALANISVSPSEDLELYADTVGDVYKVIRLEQAKEVQLIYKVLWRDVELDDRFISLDNIPEEITNKYLQLPDIPIEVWKLAKDLEDPSYSILDQVLADVQYLRTNFVYDEDRWKYLGDNFAYDIDPLTYQYERITQGSNVSSYIERRKGICIDAATALAVILRIQNIPARISIGYNPEKKVGDKLLYYTIRAHSVTEVYLPPYGWIQFDATPPLEENPVVKVLPFKKESSPGSRVFYQLSITNRYNLTDYFKLVVHSRQKWNIEAAPEEVRIEAFQTTYALLEVTIPHDADIGEKNVVTITVASLGRREVAFSILAIIEVENIFHILTTTSLEDMDEAVTRGDTFWINGTVLTTSDEQVDNMTILVFMTKSREAEGVIIGKGCSKQGNFQIECAAPYLMEIGDYRVVLISLGTTQHAPSSSDSVIRVRATTRMRLGSEEEFLLGYGAIHGRLSWDNGTGFAKANISLKMTPLATPPEVWKSQNLTFKDGSFRIRTTFPNPGVYEVNAMFSGDEYVLGSNATLVIELKRGLPAIQIFGENTAIRGEIFNITVTIQYQDIGVWGEPVTVAFDDQLLATIETRDNGSYTWSFPVDSEETLGSHIFTVALKKGNLSAVHKVAVKSKTRLTTKVSEVAGGMFLLFSASLSDDHDLPIQGAEIAVDNYGLLWKTDKNGNLTFLLDTVELWPENLSLTARYEGSELYLPVTTKKDVVFETVISLPFLIPLVFPTLVIIGFVCTKRFAGRLQIFRQNSGMEVVKERAIVEEELVHRPQKMQPLEIILPDIEAQFPNVWGIKDKLRIEIVLEKSLCASAFLEKIKRRGIEVFIDEETIASVRLSQQGCAKLTHVFIKKGEQKMRAILPRTSGLRPWSAEIKLRVVDYREEIISLYNEFLGKLASYGILARNEMTAREIESLILRMGDFSPEALCKVTALFEKAEYSIHSATRKDYEIMYLSLMELNIDVG